MSVGALQPVQHPSPLRLARPSRGEGRLTVGVVLVLVMNGLLVIRPEEFYAQISGLRAYLLAIVACLLWFSASILHELSWARLSRNPLLVLLIGIQCAVVMSHVGSFRI